MNSYQFKQTFQAHNLGLPADLSARSQIFKSFDTSGHQSKRSHLLAPNFASSFVSQTMSRKKAVPRKLVQNKFEGSLKKANFAQAMMMAKTTLGSRKVKNPSGSLARVLDAIEVYGTASQPSHSTFRP